ncbi:MAG: hypothetical protein ACTHLH_07050 [Solirubrobacterales bacterium]
MFLLALCAFVLFTTSPASAAGIVAKDGKIHACYKAKGKGKGTLRVVRNGKVRCPKRWKKTSWYASGVPGAQGEAGAPGSVGEGGTNGLPGVPGTTGTMVVKQLEDKVTELLAKVKSLEALIPTVTALCTQASALTNQINSLESVLGGLKLNAVLTTLGGLLEIPTLPGGLPSFSCPG